MIRQKTLELAQAIKEGEPYRNYSMLRQSVMQDDFLAAMLKEHKNLTVQANAFVLSNRDIPGEIQQKMQHLYEILMQEERCQDYFLAEYSLNKLMGDTMKILADSIGLNLDFLQD